MTWFAVDDSFYGHPKLASIEDPRAFADAVSLWVVAGSWCAYHLTDGAVPRGQLRRLVPFAPARGADTLVRIGLWVETADGYAFRDWHDYQPTREEVEARRVGGASRTRKWRRKRESLGRVGDASRDTVTDAVTDVSETRTRPVQYHSPSESVRAPDPAPKHMAAFADSFARSTPTDAMVIRVASETRQAIGGAPYRATSSADKHAVATVARWAESMPDPEAAARSALAGFWAAKGAKGAMSWLAEEDPGRYIPTATEAAKPAIDARAQERKRLEDEAREAQAAVAYAPLMDGEKARDRAARAWAALKRFDAQGAA